MTKIKLKHPIECDGKVIPANESLAFDANGISKYKGVTVELNKIPKSCIANEAKNTPYYRPDSRPGKHAFVEYEMQVIDPENVVERFTKMGWKARLPKDSKFGNDVIVRLPISEGSRFIKWLRRYFQTGSGPDDLAEDMKQWKEEFPEAMKVYEAQQRDKDFARAKRGVAGRTGRESYANESEQIDWKAVEKAAEPTLKAFLDMLKDTDSKEDAARKVEEVFTKIIDYPMFSQFDEVIVQSKFLSGRKAANVKRGWRSDAM